MKRKYLIILSIILCISLGLSSVSAVIIAGDNETPIANDSAAISPEKEITNISNSNGTGNDTESDKPLDSYIVTQDNVPSYKSSKLNVEVYTKFNDVETLVDFGKVSVYVDGEKIDSIDLAKVKGHAVFEIPALHETRSFKVKYEGGVSSDELQLKVNPSQKTVKVGDMSDAIPTSIKVVPSKITGHAGDVAKFSAKVVFTFNDIESVANEGYLYLLKDGKVLQVKDLTKNSNPSYSFKLEKGHKYSLMFSGAEDVGEMSLNYAPSNKNLNVKFLDYTKKDNKTKTNINMENTGVPLVVLLVVLLGLPLYFRRK